MVKGEKLLPGISVTRRALASSVSIGRYTFNELGLHGNTSE